MFSLIGCVMSSPHGPGSVRYVAAPIQRGGAWMWFLPLAWVLSGPFWIMGFAFAATAPSDVSCPPADPTTGTVPDCPAVEQAVSAQLLTFANTLLVALALCVAVAVVLGLLQGRKGVGLMFGRAGLAVATGLIATPPFVGYLVGYGLGHLFSPRGSRSRVGADLESRHSGVHAVSARPSSGAIESAAYGPLEGASAGTLDDFEGGAADLRRR